MTTIEFCLGWLSLCARRLIAIMWTPACQQSPVVLRRRDRWNVMNHDLMYVVVFVPSTGFS